MNVVTEPWFMPAAVGGSVVLGLGLVFVLDLLEQWLGVDQ